VSHKMGMFAHICNLIMIVFLPMLAIYVKSFEFSLSKYSTCFIFIILSPNQKLHASSRR